MRITSLVAAAAILLMSAVPVRAQAVTVRFHDGLVTLTARNAPLRAILAEWARLGGTTIVNGERVAGPPLTLELNAVSERQALDVILRTVSGYMLGARPAGAAGISVFDRILILPTSAAPRNPPPSAPNFPGSRPVMPQRPPLLAQPDDLVDDPLDDGLLDDDPLDDGVPVVNPLVRPRTLPGDQFPGTRPPVIIPEQDFGDDLPLEPEQAPAQTGRPASPFGIPTGATSRPGIVTPVPDAQQQPGAPRTDPEP